MYSLRWTPTFRRLMGTVTPPRLGMEKRTWRCWVLSNGQPWGGVRFAGPWSSWSGPAVPKPALSCGKKESYGQSMPRPDGTKSTSVPTERARSAAQRRRRSRSPRLARTAQRDASRSYRIRAQQRARTSRSRLPAGPSRAMPKRSRAAKLHSPPREHPIGRSRAPRAALRCLPSPRRAPRTRLVLAGRRTRPSRLPRCRAQSEGMASGDPLTLRFGSRRRYRMRKGLSTPRASRRENC